MSPMSKRPFRFHLNEDTSYKIVAFFVTLVLWINILGRKNSIVSRDVDLEFLVRTTQVVASDVRKKVRIQLSGPRMVLKKYAQLEQAYTVDLWDAEPGKHRVHLNSQGLNLPSGVQLLSIVPKELIVVIKASSKKGEGNKIEIRSSEEGSNESKWNIKDE